MSLLGKPRDERGAVAPFVAVLVVLLVGLASFAVDLGYQRVAARDMQAVADIVAMDMARELDGTKGNVLKNTDRWQDAVRVSLARNDDAAVGDKLKVVSCNYNSDTLPNGQAVLCATPGVYDPVSRTFSSGGNAPATHVRVLTRTRVDYFFPIYADEGWVTKTAYAQAETGACFTVGSYAARVNLGDGQILGPLLTALGTDIELGVLDAQGLAGAQIKLIDLVSTDLVAGGFDELLSADVALGDFYLAMADVLARDSDNAAEVALLHRLATVALRDVRINLADIVDIDSSNSAGLDAVVNVFDLVSAAAFVANGENAILVPDLAVDVVGLSTLKASVKIGQKPILRCGRPKKVAGVTSQVEVTLEGRLLNLNLGLAKIKAPIRLSLELAPADVGLEAVTCLSPQKKLDFLVTSGLLDLQVMVGDPDDRRALDVSLLFGLLPVLHGHIHLYTLPTARHQETRSTTVEADDYEAAAPAEFGLDSLGVPSLESDVAINLLGLIPIGKILEVVVDPLLSLVVNPLVDGLDQLLLSPLLGALGLNVAGAEIYAKPKADCGVPALRG